MSDRLLFNDKTGLQKVSEGGWRRGVVLPAQSIGFTVERRAPTHSLQSLQPNIDVGINDGCLVVVVVGQAAEDLVRMPGLRRKHTFLPSEKHLGLLSGCLAIGVCVHIEPHVVVVV